MKVSDAIAVGRTVVKPKPGTQFDLDESSGCALGMAVIAAGGGYSKCDPKDFKGRAGGVEDFSTWSWLAMGNQRPCSCWFSDFPHWLPRVMATKEIIAHIFDKHVFGKADWTLDQLIDWVRSVEPTTEDNDSVPVGAEVLREATQR